MNLIGQSPWPVYFPASYRTQKRLKDFSIDLPSNVTMVDPIGYRELLALLGNSRGALTDSGTVVEETAVIGVPSLQIRKATERPQVYDCGSSVKYDPARPDDYPAARVFAKLESLHGRTFDHGLGDGHASERLVSDLVERVVRRHGAGSPRGELAYRRVPFLSRGRLAGSMSSTSAPLESDTVWPSLATVVPVYNEEAGIEQSAAGRSSLSSHAIRGEPS